MKKNLYKYKDYFIIFSIFSIFLFFPIKVNKHLYDMEDALYYVTAFMFLILSGAIYFILSMFVSMICSDSSSMFPSLMNLFNKKYYSIYKDIIVFYTILDSKNTTVEVYIPNWFTVVKIGQFDYTENEESYKNKLREILERFIKIDIEDKLNKLKSKTMFNKFNNLD